jgi:Ca2+-binding RTX toxin-like protein
VRIYRIGLVAMVVAAAVGWATPAHAAAGNAYESGSILNFNAGSGTVNNVLIRLSGANYTIDDTTTIVPGFNCKNRVGDLTIVDCFAAGITEVRVWTNDLDDVIDYLTPTFSRLFAGDGNDTVWGGTGMDWLFGGNGNDYLNAWSGNDQIYWDAGADQMYGGSGWDYVSYEDTPYAVVLNLDGLAGDGGSGEGDLIGGGGGNDDIYPDYGEGAIGADYISGGTGFDRVFYVDHGTTPIVADLDGATGDDGATGEGDTIASDMEALGGSDGNDWLVGNNLANTLYGGGGDDVIVGYGDNDDLLGEAGNDYLFGGDGNDRLWGDVGNDSLYGENHADTLNGGTGTDFCDVGPGGTSSTGCE